MRQTIEWRYLLCATVLALAAAIQFAASGAAAQGYPDKTIRLVVPYGPGGSSDIVGRIVAQRLSEQLGRNVVPDNRPGAAGLIGTELVARAPADGYTLLIADAGHSSLPLIYPKVVFTRRGTSLRSRWWRRRRTCWRCIHRFPRAP